MESSVRRRGGGEGKGKRDFKGGYDKGVRFEKMHNRPTPLHLPSLYPSQLSPLTLLHSILTPRVFRSLNLSNIPTPSPFLSLWGRRNIMYIHVFFSPNPPPQINPSFKSYRIVYALSLLKKNRVCKLGPLGGRVHRFFPWENRAVGGGF